MNQNLLTIAGHSACRIRLGRACPVVRPRSSRRGCGERCRGRAPCGQVWGFNMRVLLIEDDSATAQSIELMLKSENFNVYVTDLGEEGIDLGKLYDYDIILLDLNLPDMSGYEVLRSLRRDQDQDADPDPLRHGRHRGQGEGPRPRRRRLPHQALPQGRTGRPHPRDRPPLQGPCAVGHHHRRSRRQSRPEDRRGRRPPGASDRQGISDARAALACARARR